MKHVSAIEIYILNSDGTKTFVSSGSLRIYKESDSSLIQTITVGSKGIVFPFQISSLNESDGIYYEYDYSSVTYKGGQNLSTMKFYQDVVIAADQFVGIYPEAKVPPARVEVWVKDSSDEKSTWRYFNTFKIGQQVSLPFNPLKDRSPVLSLIPIAADGTRGVGSPDHGQLVSPLFNRNADTPVIQQVGVSQQGYVELVITGQNQFTVAREVRIANNSTFTSGLMTSTFENEAARSTYFAITRGTFTGQSTEDKWISVRHSSKGPTGPWSPWSNPTLVTFAADGGTGGSTGDGNPNGGGKYEV